MQLTKGAIGNLINRYKAVLKKCHLMNTFGSLAVAGMLIMGGAGMAGAEESWTKPNGETAQWTNGVVPNGTVLQGTYKGFSQKEETLAGVATVDYTTTGVSVANGTTFTSNSKTAGAAGALKLLNGIKIGDNVTFTDNKATGNAWGGGAIYIKLADKMQPSDNQSVTIGSNAKFANNQAQTWGGAIALEYGNLTIDERAIFEGNKTLGKNGNGEEGGGAIAVWHDPSNGEPGQTRLSVTKATFRQNSTNVSGGAIYNKDGNITITGSQFDQNSSGSMGGAIANMSGKTDYTGEINITDSGFTGNTAGNGGAVWNGTNGKVNITNSTFSKNTAMLKDHSLQQGGAITNGGEMTITGSTFEDNTANKRGGAIFNSGTLTVNGGSFDGNKAGNGGAIYNATNATLKITGTSFTNNTAAGWGGAILNSGATITVTDATFANNIAQGGAGGAIGNPAEGTSSVTVSGTKFLNNHSVYDGGAIGNYGGMKIENCLFEGNTAQLAFDEEKGTWTNPVTDDTAVGGGAISLGAVSNSAVASISGTTFKNNTSGTNGGAIATRQAIHADNSAAKLDIAATFIGNKAQQGGAIYNSFYTDNGLGKGAGVTVTGTFSGNEATSKGGAIYNDGTPDKNSTKPSGGVMTITDATFDNNKADFGGAIYNTGELTFNGTNTFSGNTATEGKDIYNAGSLTMSSGSDLVVYGSGSIFNAAGGNISVKNGARLTIADAVSGGTYTVVSGEGSIRFNNDDYNAADSTGWKGENLQASSDMVILTSDDGKTFTAEGRDAHDVFTGLDDSMGDAVNSLYARHGAAGTNGWNYADVDAEERGIRFLSRATDKRFIGADHQAAAATIESAARIAFAGAVPQMTKMASDAGTNAVVNRLGFANPADGAQAMDAEGKIVDRNTTGFALWIAPLWQSQHGWGMEAGNLDYGFNGNLGGVSLGADYTFENAIRAGITFNIGGGYAESSGGDLNSTENRMSFWGLGAYAGWNYENFGLMADVSYTSTWNDLKQDMDSRMGMGDLEADVQASAISAGLRAEYKLETSVLDVIPHIGVRYMSLNTWGFDAESNGGTVLEGDGFHQDIWTFPVGVTFTKDFTLDSGWSFKPSIDFSVIPAAGDIKAKQDVAFTGLPGSYEVETQMMDYLTWQGGVGLEMGNDTMSFGVNYTLQAGQHTTGHGVFGSFRYEF